VVSVTDPYGRILEFLDRVYLYILKETITGFISNKPKRQALWGVSRHREVELVNLYKGCGGKRDTSIRVLDRTKTGYQILN
jgi:hypothetical protein